MMGTLVIKGLNHRFQGVPILGPPICPKADSGEYQTGSIRVHILEMITWLIANCYLFSIITS